LITNLIDKLANRKVRNILSFSIISALVIFGLVNFMIPLTKINNDNRFSEVALVLRYLEENKNENITTISNDVYSWIPKYVFQLDSDYLIPEIGNDENPQNEKVLMVVDGAFRDVLSTHDAIGKHLNKIYNEHSKDGTTILGDGLNKIVLPQAWPSNLTRYSVINLVDNWHVWKPNSNSSINISQSDNNLTILVDTNKKHRITKHAFLHTELKNLTGTPLLLSLEYASKSPSLNTKYYLQIKDNDGQNRRYYKRDLSDTSGNLTKNLFILPSNILDKPLEFRLGIQANSTGDHMLSLKTAMIISPSPH
jgi:hypothetical protein